MNETLPLSYEMLPPTWTFCFLDGCPKADECMRHLSGKYVPKTVTSGLSVFPTAMTNDGCGHFKQIRTMHVAYGFATIFDEVKSKDEKSIRDSIKSYLGSQKTYYRYHNGEKLLTPEQQRWIVNLFRQYGYTDNLKFDHYRDVYDFS